MTKTKHERFIRLHFRCVDCGNEEDRTVLATEVYRQHCTQIIGVSSFGEELCARKLIACARLSRENFFADQAESQLDWAEDRTRVAPSVGYDEQYGEEFES